MEVLPVPGRMARWLGYPRVGSLPSNRQSSLRAFWLDGVFASLFTAFSNPYYTLYLLALGATNAQIGLVSTLSQLAGAGLALPGAAIADRTGRYKRVAFTAGVFVRLMLPLMILAPLLARDKAVWLIIFAQVGIVGFGTLGNAAWTALSAELVPNSMRGTYFASRNIAMQLVQLAAIPLAGQVVNFAGEPGGYQINLVLALLLGVVSLYFYNQLMEHENTPHEAPVQKPAHPRRFAGLWQIFRERPAFGWFVMAHGLLLFGTLIGGPFIQVYMVQVAHFDVGTIGLTTTVSVFSAMIGNRIFGRLHDRLGITRTMQFGILIPVLPVLWLWVTEPWQAYLVQLLAGFVWSGYNLGAFNLLLAVTPDDHRPRYVAIQTTIVSVVSAIGPLIGGWLLDVTGFMPVFSLSTIVRAIGLIVFVAAVREPVRTVLTGRQGAAASE